MRKREEIVDAVDERARGEAQQGGNGNRPPLQPGVTDRVTPDRCKGDVDHRPREAPGRGFERRPMCYAVLLANAFRTISGSRAITFK